jgi:hypothetical protein
LRHIIVTTLLCSVCIHHWILRHLLLGFCLQNLESGFIVTWLSVHLFNIHPRFFWKFRAYI